MKTVIFNQFFGLGDILFLMPLAYQYRALGYDVIFPIAGKYLEIQKHFPEILFIEKKFLDIDYDNKTIHEQDGATVIPFRWSNQFMQVPYRWVMRAKYDMVEADFNDWRKLEWKRDVEAETSLMKRLGIKKGDRYCVANSVYAGIGGGGKAIVLKPQVDMTIVWMDKIEGVTLLDWTMVLENATEIHTVHTAVQYMLEVMKLKCVPHIYKRLPQEPFHTYYDYLFKQPYFYE